MNSFCGNEHPFAYCGKPLVRACDFHNAIWGIMQSRSQEERSSSVIEAFEILRKNPQAEIVQMPSTNGKKSIKKKSKIPSKASLKRFKLLS
jgi:hypothetical protein